MFVCFVKQIHRFNSSLMKYCFEKKYGNRHCILEISKNYANFQFYQKIYCAQNMWIQTSKMKKKIEKYKIIFG